MRPVNLIPLEERRANAPARSGPVAYLIVGALALGLAAVTMIVLTDNKIADRKSQIAKLSQQQAEVQARVSQLKPFVDFSQTERQRVSAIRSVADNRFDWERVMHELSLVLPGGVSLTNLTATSGGTPDASGVVTDTAPNLSIMGCARDHQTVAGFLASLKDIDGVTAVSLQSSQRIQAGSSGGSSSTISSSSDCGSAFQFQLTALFGDAPTGASSTGASPTAPAPTASATAAPTSATTAPTSTGG